MRYNAVNNDMMDLALILGGIEVKACDFDTADDVVVSGRRQHDRAEDVRSDALARVRKSGKKHREDRTREDYKMVKAQNEFARDMRLWRGGYDDRCGCYKNRRDSQRLEDEMRNAMADYNYLIEEEARAEQKRREEFANAVDAVVALREEADQLFMRARNMNERAEKMLEAADRLAEKFNIFMF